MAGKEGFHRVMTVDDGKTWYRLKSGEKTSSEVDAHTDVQADPQADTQSESQVGNMCESTVEMCSKAIGSKDGSQVGSEAGFQIGPQNGAECLSPEQKFDSLVAFYENAYRNAQIDELDRILEDDDSNEFQRSAVANLRQRLMIKQGLIAPDKGNY